MNEKINAKTKVSKKRDIKINDYLQKMGERVHKIDSNDYCKGKLILTSDDYEQLYEAVLVAEDFLAYNGSWDFRRNLNKNNDNNVCEILFKWNGYVSTMDTINNKIKLPEGVKKEFIFLTDK